MLNVDRTEVDAGGKYINEENLWSEYWWGEAEERKKVEDFQSYKEAEDVKQSRISSKNVNENRAHLVAKCFEEPMALLQS